MKTDQNKFLWIILVLSVILLIPGLGHTSLWIFDEVRNAECAREMYQRNDWIVPTFNGQLRAVKPPLHYYFMFAGFKIFGINEWGARFFSAVFGILTVLITYLFTKRFSTAKHGFIASLVLLASTHFLFEFRMSVPDPYLIFFNVAAIFTAFSYFIEKKTSWIILCAVSLGLGTLAKGPVALALPGAVIFIWLLWERRLKEILSWKIVIAAVITLVIAVPWYIAVHTATDGAFTKGFFLDNNIKRFSSELEGHGGPFFVIPLFVLLGLLPATVFSAGVFKKSTGIFKDSFLRMCLVAVLFYIIFYSFSGTKLPNYPMPSYAFFAVLLGNYITGLAEGRHKHKLYPFIILFIISLSLIIGGWIGVKNEVATAGLENRAFYILILTAGIAVSLFFLIKTKKMSRALIILFSAYTLFNLVFLNYLYPLVYHNNPMIKTISQVKEYRNIAGYRNFHPSYTFYLPDRVPLFTDKDSLKNYLKDHAALVITRTEYENELNDLDLKKVASYHDIFELPTTLLLTNK